MGKRHSHGIRLSPGLKTLEAKSWPRCCQTRRGWQHHGPKLGQIGPNLAKTLSREAGWSR